MQQLDGISDVEWSRVKAVRFGALMRHPGLDDAATRARLGVDHLRIATRFSQGKFMNFSPAYPG